MSDANSEPAMGNADRCKDCSRRDFFAKLGLCSLMVAGAGVGFFAYEYLSPNVLFEPSPVVKAGKPDEFPLDSVTLEPQNAIYLINSDKGFYALGAICTHLGCLTAWRADLNLIACPCHGSRFNRDGIKVAGPAPQPLPRFKVWLSAGGDLMVDRSEILRAAEFVKV